MKLNVYSIFDIKAEEYGPLFVAKNNEVAFRLCRNQFKDVPCPQDYELSCVGDFDNETGEMNGHYIFVCNLGDLLEDFLEENK